MIVYALMVYLCSPGICEYKPYHDMKFDSMVDCQTALLFLQKVHGATPPKLKCEETGRKI